MAGPGSPARGARLTGPAVALRRRAGAGAARAGHWALRALPETVAGHAGAAAAALLARALPRYRRIARANLSVAYPGWSPARREALLRRHLRQLGRHAATWSRWADADPASLLRRLDFDGVEALAAACAAGRGALVVTAHYGCWELLLPALRARLPGQRCVAVGRVPPDPTLQRLVADARAGRDGRGALPRDAWAVRRALRAGAAVGVLADHRTPPRRGGVLLPFLGAHAWTSTAPARLARAHRLPLLLVRTLPLPDGRQRVEIGPVLAAPDRRDGAEGVVHTTVRLNQVIEGWVRERPEQWLWLSERFRDSPDARAAVAARGVARGVPGRGRRPGSALSVGR